MKIPDDVVPMCCNCKRGKLIPLTNYVLCEIHGVVCTDYYCKKYSFNLFLKKVKRKHKINTEEFTQEDFSIN